MSKKKFILSLFAIGLTLSCSENSVSDNNPFLPNYTFSFTIDRTFGTYNDLNFAGNGFFYSQAGAGVRGVIIFNTGNGINAWEAACPNQQLATCSSMTISGVNAKCPCDNKLYSLYTGQSAGEKYPMKQYRTEVNGSVIRVFN
jgi:nitrite reductase/ring-hydroxylating ferredoxin subunit